MTDDLVTRLRACWCDTDYSSRGRVDPYCDHDGVRSDAADEIERLRAIIRGISDAVTIEGRNPAHHRSVVAQVQTDWPWFWSQIQVALKEVSGD